MKRWGWVFAVGLVSTGRLAAAAEVEVEVVNSVDCDQPYGDQSEGWMALPPAAEDIALAAVLPLPVSLDLFGDKADAAVPFLTVDVTAPDGSAVPGMVESLDPAGRYVAWRPEEILSPGEVYEVRLFADNEAMRTSDQIPFFQDPINIEELWSFTVSDESPTVVDWEAVDVQAEYVIEETISYGAFSDEESELVCCDETYPLFDTKRSCVSLRSGTCGSRQAQGVARASVELASHPAAVGSNTALDIGTWSDASGLACATVTRTNRSDGSQEQREFCQELEGPLGELADYDVEARLAEVCEGVPYTCTAGLPADWGYYWEPENCMDATGEEPGDTDADADADADLESGTGGCGCSASSTPPPLAILGMLLLVAGLRRLRQTESRRSTEACRRSAASSRLRTGS